MPNLDGGEFVPALTSFCPSPLARATRTLAGLYYGVGTDSFPVRGAVVAQCDE